MVAAPDNYMASQTDLHSLNLYWPLGIRKDDQLPNSYNCLLQKPKIIQQFFLLFVNQPKVIDVIQIRINLYLYTYKVEEFGLNIYTFENID